MASISISGWSGSNGRTFTLTVTEQSYDSIANTSVVKWTLSASGDGQWYNTYLYASVNGTAVFNAYKGWETGEFPAADGSRSGTATISHNADGTKSISFYIEGYCYQGSWDSRSKSGSLTLTSIDRAAPTITQADISNIDVTSFTISATSDVNCDSWDYSLNNGSSWVNFSTTNGTSANKTITGLTMNTDYTVLIRARKTLNQVYGTSGSKTAKTLGSSTITLAGNVTLGNSCNVKWTPLNSTFKFTLKFSLGSWSYTTGYITPSSTSAYTYTGYTIPLTVANQLPNTTTGTMTVVLTTYTSSNAQVGSASSATFTVTVPSSVVPTISSVTLQEGTTSGYGVYVKTLSTVKATVTASGAYSSTIASRVVKFGAVSITANSSGVATSPVLSTYGTMTVLTTVTDSRGRTATNTQNITVYDYWQPTANIEISISGTTVTTTVTGSIAPVNNLNAKSLLITRKRMSDSSTTTYSVNPLSAYNYSVTWTQTVADIGTESYEYTAAVTDTKQTVTVKQQTAVICISRLAGGRGVTFFGEAQNEGIWIVNNGTYVELDYIVEQGTNGIWTYRKWNSGVAECWGTDRTTITSWSPWGSGYLSSPNINVNFPTNFFIASPNCSLFVTLSNGGSVIEVHSTVTASRVSAIQGMRMTTTDTNIYFYASIYAIGRWK